ETVFPQRPKVAAGQSFRKIVVELRVCVAIEVQAEIFVTGCRIMRRGKIQVGPVEFFRTFGGSLQAAGKPIDRQHLQVRCLPGTREGAQQVTRPCRGREYPEELFDVFYGSLLFGESSPQRV